MFRTIIRLFFFLMSMRRNDEHLLAAFYRSWIGIQNNYHRAVNRVPLPAAIWRQKCFFFLYLFFPPFPAAAAVVGRVACFAVLCLALTVSLQGFLSDRAPRPPTGGFVLLRMTLAPLPPPPLPLLSLLPTSPHCSPTCRFSCPWTTPPCTSLSPLTWGCPCAAWRSSTNQPTPSSSSSSSPTATTPASLTSATTPPPLGSPLYPPPSNHHFLSPPPCPAPPLPVALPVRGRSDYSLSFSL